MFVSSALFPTSMSFAISHEHNSNDRINLSFSSLWSQDKFFSLAKYQRTPSSKFHFGSALLFRFFSLSCCLVVVFCPSNIFTLRSFFEEKSLTQKAVQLMFFSSLPLPIAVGSSWWIHWWSELNFTGSVGNEVTVNLAPLCNFLMLFINDDTKSIYEAVCRGHSADDHEWVCVAFYRLRWKNRLGCQWLEI